MAVTSVLYGSVISNKDWDNCNCDLVLYGSVIFLEILKPF